jgi:hypothetical protein
MTAARETKTQKLPAGWPAGMSPRAYLAFAATLAATAFAAVWLWVALAPLTFLDPEYASWLAKERFLAHCDLGGVVLVGDSRAAADIEPALLPVRATNLALGGGEPIEAYVALHRALACANPPNRVVISFSAGHFVLPDLFWQRSVGYGFLSFMDLEQLRTASRHLRDDSIYAMPLSDGLPPRFRAALYALRFPPLYFGSLLHGGVFLRAWENEAGLDRATRSRGQYFFGTAPGASVVAIDGHLETFRPLPILDWYFDRMLALLAARGIEADFVATPMNEATWDSVRPEVRTAFTAYLQRYAARYPNLHLIGPAMPHWPDRYFGDAFSHLNPEGAARFSRAFSAWLSGAPSLVTAGR